MCGNDTTHRPHRGTLDRGTSRRGTPRTPGTTPRSVTPGAGGGGVSPGAPPVTAPSGVAVTVERAITIDVPRPLRPSVGVFFVKPRFRGIAQISFGATNPRVALVQHGSQLDIELNRAISQAVIQRTTYEITQREVSLMGSIADGVSQGQIRSGDALRLFLGARIRTLYVVQNWELEPIFPPEVSTNAIRAKVSLVFGRVTGQWNRKIFETQIFGVPVRIQLTGEVEFDFGISVGGWRMLVQLLARHGGSLGAAAEMAYLETHLVVGGAANGLLGFATPAIVVVGTPVVTFGIDYFWAHYITYLRRVGERRGLLNQAASGFIRRTFHPRSGRMYWYQGSSTGSRRRMRTAGIQLAEALLRDTPPEVLQAIVYRELDYHHRHQALTSDLTFRLGELWFAGRRLGAQGSHAAPAGGRSSVPFF